MSKGNVLLIGSNASSIEVKGGKLRPTGYYLNELVVPTMAVLNAGYDVILATPNGAKPVLDEVSRAALHFGNSEQRLQEAVRFVDTHPVMQHPRALRSVLDEGLNDYRGLFVPGGQAPVVDLMQDETLGEILRDFHERQKPSAFLCHGPIATLAALPCARDYRAALVEGDTAKANYLAQGWPYAGYRMTIWSNLEERWLEDNILHAKVLFRTVDALQTAGGRVTTSAKVFEPHLEVDRELITGQNPASDHALASALVKALDQQRV
jgi:putative intracellular protease/amidase